MDLIHHPSVEILWNYWPLTMVVWTPFRLVLNAIFFLPNILSAPVSAVWNIGPELLILSSLWLISFPLFVPHLVSGFMNVDVQITSVLLALMLHVAW